MKRMIMILALVAIAASAAPAQFSRLQVSKGNAFRSDTVRTTATRIATKNFDAYRKISVVNMGKVNGGTGDLWVGQIFIGGRADTSTTRDGSGWYGAVRIHTIQSGYFCSIEIDPTTCDTIYLKSTDSTWVELYQR